MRFHLNPNASEMHKQETTTILLLAVVALLAPPRARATTPRCYANHLDPADPRSLAYYRALADHLDASGEPRLGLGLGRLERVPAGPIATPADANGTAAPVDGEGRDVRLMRLSALFSFLSKKYDEATGEPYLTYRGREKNRWGVAAATLLAARHFNVGDGSVVRELEGIHERCPVRIVADFFDAESNARSAIDVLSNEILGGHGDDRAPAATAVLGDVYSSTSVPVATMTGVYDVPQACPTCTTTELDDVRQYPHFARVLPSDAGTARAIVSFAHQRHRDAHGEGLGHLGVLYKDDAFGTAYYLALKDTEYYWVYARDRAAEGSASAVDPGGGASDDGASRSSERIDVHGAHYTSADDVDEAVRNLARTGYRVFVGVFYTGDYERVMESAHRHGIAGPGYTWILTDGFGPDYFHGKAFPEGSPLAVASQGLGVVMAHGGRRTEAGGTGYDRLMDAWTRQTDRFVDYVNCVGRPRTNSLGDADAYYKADGGFFQDLDLAPPQLVFFYDSVVSFGLAACDLLDGDGEASEIDGGKLADAFVRQEYEGSSGFVSLDPETRGRRPGSAFFAAYNAQGTTREGGVVTFEMDVVAHTVPGKASDAATGIVWTNVSGKAYRYSDNTTDFPRGLPEISDFYDNRIGPVARGTFLFLASVVFASSLFFSGWTFRHRKERVVRSSQPMFLHMICVGTLLMGASIVTLSIDDGIASERACSVACMLNHWFLAIGFAFAFTSLFAKEWRINKIFHNPSLRRIKVEPKDVIVPLVVLLGINILVLTLWTALSPMTWDRYFVGTVDKYGRDLESVGMCVGYAKDWVPYASILLITNFSAVALASFQAYRARKITVEYTESKWVAVILVAILQAVAIGIPLIALMDGNPTANFVVRAGLIFIICITFLLAMFVPKLIYHNDAVEAAKKKQSRIRESALRHTAFMARVAAQNDGAVDSQNFTPSLRRRSGVRVLFHPKSHEDEMEALKDELQNTKQELRYLIDQARQSENHEFLSRLSRISDVDENDRDTVNSSEPLPLERA